MLSMINTIQITLFYILIAKLGMTLYQRRYNETGGNKRLASLYQSLLIGALYGGVSIVKTKDLPIILFYVLVGIVVFISIRSRKSIFPYNSQCSSCGKKLKLTQILFLDNQKCNQCEN